MTIFKSSFFLASCLFLIGCQSNSVIHTEPVIPQATLPPVVTKPESKVTITPYPDSTIRQESIALPSTPVTQPPRVILPEQVQQPQQATRQLKDGQGIAAYEKAMQDYMVYLRQNNIAEAEKYLLQAQRIAPQSADVYRELARLANVKKQGSTAEAFARKGLSFAQNNVQRKQLWQQILVSAQMRQLPHLVQQAQQQITRY